MLRFLIAFLVACDALAPADYVGEPLFTIEGAFASNETAPADPLGGVALFWQDPNGPDGPGVASTTVPVEIQFPASFRVAIPVPPPTAARFSFGDGDGEVELAEAYVFVVETTNDHPAPHGGERSHVVVWASTEVADGSLAADYLGGPISDGYHLRTFSVVANAGTAQHAMIERCIASGATRRTCEVRRGYQLTTSGDHERLKITVSPP